MTMSGSSLASWDLRFRSERLRDKTPLNSSVQLQRFLEGWVLEKNKDQHLIGTIEPLWELVRILDLKAPERVESVLRKVELRWNSANGRDPYQMYYYAPLPLTLATYMIDEMIMQSPIGLRGMDEILQTKVGSELHRYRIEVIKNSFLWLDDLVKPPANWVGLLFLEFDEELDRIVIERLGCMRTERVKGFHDRTLGQPALKAKDVQDLESLWLMFSNNSSRPVQFAFRLARLGAKGSWSGADDDGWGEFDDLVNYLFKSQR
ncbi:hypothetical protein BDV12DRAFT_42553 [Aspergillus spectabilis]